MNRKGFFEQAEEIDKETKGIEPNGDYVDEVMELFIAEKGREPESILEFLDFFYRREGTECDRTN